MNKKELHEKVLELMPTSYGQNEEFLNHLKKSLDKYKNILFRYIESIPTAKERRGMITVQKRVLSLNKTLKRTVELYLQGKQYSAYYELTQFLKDKRYILYTVCKDTKYYRMRSIDANKPVNREELFHIPLNVRGLVTTQRYSSPGHPCLYLGNSIYICWEEMHRPPLANCFVAGFETQKSFKVLDMSIPNYDLWVNDDEYFKCSLTRIPLIIASMVQVKTNTDVFKPEYIIPQILMANVIENNNKIGNRNPIGIYYTSVCKNNDFVFEHHEHIKLSNNLAIPVQKVNKGKFCPILCSLFHTTEPTCEEWERAKNPFEVQIESNCNKLPNKYDNTVFGKLEKRILNYKFDNIRLIN